MLIQAGFWHCTSRHEFTTQFLEQLQSTDVPTLKCFLLLDDLAASSVVCSCAPLRPTQSMINLGIGRSSLFKACHLKRLGTKWSLTLHSELI